MTPRENDPRSPGRTPRDDAPDPCAPFRKLVVDDRFGELAPAEALRLEEHLAECPACARLLADESSLLDAALDEGIDRWARRARAPSVASAGDARRTLEGVRRKLGRGTLLRRSIAASLVAAGLLVASAIAFLPGERLGAEDRVIIQNLEVLEDIEEEGGELTDEIVNLLLEELDDGTEVLEDSAIFDYILESEIQEEL